MTNTALFDTLRRAGPITNEQIGAIADAVQIRMAPLASQVGDLQAKADAISSTASALVTEVQRIGGTVQSLPDELAAIKSATAQILERVPPPHLSDSSFDHLRKCLQVLNRLEDWDLADNFDGRNEFKRDEFEHLKSKCLEQCGNDPVVAGMLSGLEKQFPSTKSSQVRADYYVEILVARLAILRRPGVSR